MSFASKHNKGAIDWGIDTSEFAYLSRKECFDSNPEAVHVVRGLYINTKGNFGDHPVAICENSFIDLPDYLTNDVKEMLQDEEDINDIKAGKVGFKIEKFIDKKFKKECFGIKWVDVLPKE